MRHLIARARRLKRAIRQQQSPATMYVIRYNTTRGAPGNVHPHNTETVRRAARCEQDCSVDPHSNSKSFDANGHAKLLPTSPEAPSHFIQVDSPETFSSWARNRMPQAQVRKRLLLHAPQKAVNGEDEPTSPGLEIEVDFCVDIEHERWWVP